MSKASPKTRLEIYRFWLTNILHIFCVLYLLCGWVANTLSYIPLPIPIRAKSLSIPSAGISAKSIFLGIYELRLGSKIPNVFFTKGSRYNNILKLSPFIVGKKILLFLFFLSFFSNGKIFASKGRG